MTQALNETLVLSYLATSTKTTADLHELTELYTRLYEAPIHSTGPSMSRVMSTRGGGSIEGKERGYFSAAVYLFMRLFMHTFLLYNFPFTS